MSQFGFEHQFCQGDDGVHRRTDLMADVGQEMGFCPIGLFSVFFCMAEHVFRMLALDSGTERVCSGFQDINFRGEPFPFFYVFVKSNAPPPV